MILIHKTKKLSASHKDNRPEPGNSTHPTRTSTQMNEDHHLRKSKSKWYRRAFAACPRFKQFLEAQSSPTTSTSDAPTLSHKLRRSFTPAKKNENFQRNIDVQIWDEGHSRWSQVNPGLVLVDTQSEQNLITPQFLDVFGLSPSPSIKPIRIILSNNTEVRCLGEVRARWYGRREPQKLPNFRPRYENTTFQVVDLETFDLVIGSETIVELQLLQGNRKLFGAYRTLHPRVDSYTVDKKQREANERRKREQEEMKKHEQQKAQAAAVRKP